MEKNYFFPVGVVVGVVEIVGMVESSTEVVIVVVIAVVETVDPS
jgi:hypothetical protein